MTSRTDPSRLVHAREPHPEREDNAYALQDQAAELRRQMALLEPLEAGNAEMIEETR